MQQYTTLQFLTNHNTSKNFKQLFLMFYNHGTVFFFIQEQNVLYTGFTTTPH